MVEMDYRDYAEYLNYAVSNGILDVSKLVADVEMDKRQEILSNHKYSVWQGVTNKKWNTYLPAEGFPNNRRIISRNSKKKIEDAIVEFYTENERIPDFGECFAMQQEYTLKHYKITTNTYDRKNNDYDKYIRDTRLDRTAIDQITEGDIVMFLDDMLAEYNGKITRKAFNNVKSIIGTVFVFSKVIKRYNCIYTRELLAGISPNVRQLKKKSNKLQVFNDEEVDMLVDTILNNYRDSIRHMGLLFMLFTGVRVGELALLKLNDFSLGYKLQVQRTLSKAKDKNGKSHRVISEYAKTETSENEVMLSDDAIDVLNHILKLREIAGETGEWLMEEGGAYISDTKFDKCLRKLCNELAIPERSCHKLRKTYCSELLDMGVSEKVVQNQMRHSDVRTTQNHYNYCVKTEKAKRDAINKVRRLSSAF